MIVGYPSRLAPCTPQLRRPKFITTLFGMLRLMEIQQSLAERTQDSSLMIDSCLESSGNLGAENVELLSLRIKLTRSVTWNLLKMNLDDIKKAMELSTGEDIKSPQLVGNVSKKACGRFSGVGGGNLYS